MTKEIAKKESSAIVKTSDYSQYKQTQIYSELQSFEKKLLVALPKEISKERFLQVVSNMIFKNPQLAKCSKLSLFGAIMESAQLGFIPANSLGLCYFVPFYNSKTKQHECQFMIGYKGKQSLIRRSGLISAIYAKNVYKGELFEVHEGTENKIIHKPNYELDRTDYHNIVATYAVAEFKDGAKQFIVLSKNEVESYRKRSMTQKKDGSASIVPLYIWATDYPVMAMKTAIHRLSSYLPLDYDVMAHIAADEQVLTAANFIDGQINPESFEHDEPEQTVDYEVVKEKNDLFDGIEEAEK